MNMNSHMEFLLYDHFGRFRNVVVNSRNTLYKTEHGIRSSWKLTNRRYNKWTITYL